MKNIVEKIRALSERTVENGCSESEALIAAKKMSALMEKHNISLSEVNMKERSCSGLEVQTGTSRMPRWIADLASFCAWHYDAKLIYTGSILTFFGLSEGAEAGKALFNVLSSAVKCETSLYMLTSEYFNNRKFNSSRVLTNSFRLGMVYRLSERLEEIKKQRDASVEKTTGTSLVVVKDALVEEEARKAFSDIKTAKNTDPAIDYDALMSGKAAGNNVSLGDQVCHGG